MSRLIGRRSIASYLCEAYAFAGESPDPSTQNGALIVSRGGLVLARGFNTFPPGVEPRPSRLDRPAKYAFVEHAERAAIYAAARLGVATDGLTLVCPWFACADCARAIVSAGIARVVGHRDARDRTPADSPWMASILDGDAILKEAGVEVVWHDGYLSAPTVRFCGDLVMP